MYSDPASRVIIARAALCKLQIRIHRGREITCWALCVDDDCESRDSLDTPLTRQRKAFRLLCTVHIMERGYSFSVAVYEVYSDFRYDACFSGDR